MLLKLLPSIITVFSTLECRWLNFSEQIQNKSLRLELSFPIAADFVFEICMFFPRQILERKDGFRQGRDQLVPQEWEQESMTCSKLLEELNLLSTSKPSSLSICYSTVFSDTGKYWIRLDLKVIKCTTIINFQELKPGAVKQEKKTLVLVVT